MGRQTFTVSRGGAAATKNASNSGWVNRDLTKAPRGRATDISPKRPPGSVARLLPICRCRQQNHTPERPPFCPPSPFHNLPPVFPIPSTSYFRLPPPRMLYKGMRTVGPDSSGPTGRSSVQQSEARQKDRRFRLSKPRRDRPGSQSYFSRMLRIILPQRVWLSSSASLSRAGATMICRPAISSRLPGPNTTLLGGLFGLRGFAAELS